MSANLGFMYFECVNGYSNKFYKMEFEYDEGNSGGDDEWIVRTTYGRRGKRGVTDCKRFTFKNDAVKFITNNIKTRVKHGYHLMGTPTLQLS